VEETLQKSEYTRGELLSEVERRVAATRDGGDPETEPAPREPAEDAAAREAAAETGPDASTAGDDLPEGEPFSENDDESLPGEEPPAREETSEAPSDEDPEAPVEENPSAAPVSTKEDPDDGPREDETSAPEEAVSEEADPDETPPEETASREDTGDDADAAPTPNAEAEEDPEAADDDAPPAQPPAEEEPSESRNAPAADPADGEGKPLILLVEDNEHNYDMLSRRLRRRGYEVELATDGQTGVEKAEAVHPNLILMDINLPVLNGKEATRRIRAFPEGGQVPIIALTAHAMSGDREEALEAGCDRYHSKPVELPELMEQIEELLAS
jgi:CheY-like chemotaxis protein